MIQALQRVIDTIICWTKWAVIEMINGIIGILNIVANVFVLVVNQALELLPDAPTSPQLVAPPGWLAAINYCIPLGTIGAEFVLLIGLWIIYRAVQTILAYLRLDF